MKHFVSYLEVIAFFINQGGPVNIVISVLYILWFTLLLEKTVFFLLTRIRNTGLIRKTVSAFKASSEDEPPLSFKEILKRIGNAFSQSGNNYFIRRLKDGLGEGKTDIDSILSKGEQRKWKNGYLIPLTDTYLNTVPKGEKRLTAALEDQGEKTVTRMERGLWVLSELGHIAPLLGLLGTVIGLINAFGTISEKGAAVEVSDLASGIWVAMLTTANGLILALLSFLTFKIFDRIIKRRETYLSRVVAVLDNHFDVSRPVEIQPAKNKPQSPVQETI